MDIFGFLSLIGGLALFLYGMNVMGGGLEKLSGGKLERILENLTSNPLKAVLLGAGVTAVIQSSSATTVMLVGFPFTRGLEKLAYLTIPVTEEEKLSSDGENEFKILDVRFLSTPGFAIEQCTSLVRKMAEIAEKAMTEAMGLFENYSRKQAESVKYHEDLLDKYEDKLGSYLTRLNSQNLTAREGQSVSALMHSINDFERIGDHALNLMELAGDMKKRELEFSRKARLEMEVFGDAVQDILNRSIQAFVQHDTSLAMTVEPLEEVIDDLNKEMKKRHIKRLRKGKCTIELGMILSEIAVNYERVADHCSNLAVYMIQMEDNTVEAHDYVNNLSEETRVRFARMQEDYQEKYQFPS